MDERDDWLHAVERARRERRTQIELTAIVSPLLDSLGPFLDAHGALLDGFERVSLHAPVRAVDLHATVDQISALPLDGDVIFHPDNWMNEVSLDRLKGRVVFENMDVAKSFGKSVDELRGAFERWPVAGFCLDVAHVWTNDRTLALGHDLLDAFGDQLRQLHVSGIEPDGTHRTTTHDDLALYAPLLDRCLAVPWILEAVLDDPPNAT